MESMAKKKIGRAEQSMTTRVETGPTALARIEKKTLTVAELALDVMFKGLTGKKVSKIQGDLAKSALALVPKSTEDRASGQQFHLHFNVPRPKDGGEIEAEQESSATSSSASSSRGSAGGKRQRP